MVDTTTIGQLPTGQPLTGTEAIPADQSGVTIQITPNEINALVTSTVNAAVTAAQAAEAGTIQQGNSILTSMQAVVAAGTHTGFGSTANALSTGVIGLTIVGGSGATVTGSFPVTFSGGGGTGASMTVSVSGGTITGFTRQSSGYGYTSVPTATVSVTGLSGYTLTPIIGVNTVPGQYFYVPNTTTTSIDMYQNVAGAASYIFSIYSGPQILPKESGFLFAVCDAVGQAALTVGLDGTVSATKFVPPAGSVSQTQLSTGLAKYIPSFMSASETGYVFAILDANDNIGLAITATGQMIAPGLNLSPNSVSRSQLATSVSQYIPTTLPDESGYYYAIVDANNNIAFGITSGGAIVAPGLSIPAGSIGRSQLSSTLSPYIATALPPESGYVWAVVDALGQLAFGVNTSGQMVGSSGLGTAAGSVAEAQLSPLLDRQIMPHVTDIVEVEPDSWRANLGSVAVRTKADGTCWSAFPSIKTRTLRGINASGTSIQFRRTSGLTITGKRAGGSWSPVATNNVTSTTFVGQVYNYSGSVSTVYGSATALPSSGTAGQYYRFASTTSCTYSGVTLVMGDLIVWSTTSAAWVVQQAPITGAGGAPIGNRSEGDWWIVTAAGTFDAITYAVGDRIVYLGMDSLSGNGNALWYHGKPANGECYYWGEFVPGSASLPSSPSTGDLYQASAAGTDTTSGLTFAVADYALYDTGVWGNIPSDTITTVAAGAMFPGLKCNVSASEWEVRRTDKSSTIVGVVPSCRHQSSPKVFADNVLLLSDSMFGVPSMQPKLQVLQPTRTVSLITRGGGTSRNVLSTYEAYITNSGDPYRGQFTFFWHGQNNQPSTVGDPNWSMIVEASHRFSDLLGTRDKRFCFLSVMGQDIMSWNSGLGRIYMSQLENQKAQTGVLYALKQFYNSMWPGQVIHPYDALIAAAATYATNQDVRTPGTGATEAQNAATYGWLPWSWFLQYSLTDGTSGGSIFPFAISSLSLKGFWNATALPTGGSTYDCYTRNGIGGVAGTTGSGMNVGNILVNIGSGVWKEYYVDSTHLGSATGQGGTYLTNVLNSYLTTNVF